MITYYVHPVIDNHVWVTTKYKRKKKVIERIAFQIDLPGRWFEEEFNCHVDGCDYHFDNMEKCLNHGATVLQFNNEEFQFLNTEEVYNPHA